MRSVVVLMVGCLMSRMQVSFGYEYVRTALVGARGVGEVVLRGEDVPGIVVPTGVRECDLKPWQHHVSARGGSAVADDSANEEKVSGRIDAS